MARVCAIVVNYNGGEYLLRCVASLLHQSLPLYAVVVVDNASTDESIAAATQAFPQVHLLHAGANVGFAAGCNLGVKRAVALGADSVVLLNPDAEAHRDWSARLASAAMNHPEIAMFASRMMSMQRPAEIDGLGDCYHPSGLAWRYGHGQPLSALKQIPSDAFGPCGGAALYRLAPLLEVGGFDESFFCYLEDVDIAFRLRLQGYQCIYVHDAVVDHYGSYITGYRSDFTTFYGHRNLLWVWLKNMPTPLLVASAPAHLFLHLLLFVVSAARGQLMVSVRARLQALRGLRRVLGQRRQIQAARTASTSSLLRAMSSWTERWRL